MTTMFERGFTVIEVMLFLAITGALFAALMVGVNTNLTQQHYRESVRTLSTALQEQYSEVDNTRNDRDDGWECADGVVSEDSNIGVPRGTSNCVILGRAVQIDGSSVHSFSVIGTEPQQTTATSDIDVLVAYDPKISTYDESQSTLGWSSSLKTTEGTSSLVSLLILHSPVSGLLRVFTFTGDLSGGIVDNINADAASKIVKICVDGSRGLLPTQSVRVEPRIAGPDGVRVNENDPECAS